VHSRGRHYPSDKSSIVHIPPHECDLRVAEDKLGDPWGEHSRTKVLVPDLGLLCQRRSVRELSDPRRHTTESEGPCCDAEGMSGVSSVMKADAKGGGVSSPELVCTV
jgi:hypothetical protein